MLKFLPVLLSLLVLTLAILSGYLYTKLSSTENALSSSEGDKAALTANLDDTRAELLQTAATLATTESALASTEATLASTKRTLTSTESALRGQLSENLDLQGVNQELSDANAALLADKSAIEEANLVLTASLEDTRAELSQTAATLATTESALNAETDRRRTLARELNGLTIMVGTRDSLEEEVGQLREDKLALDDEIAELSAYIAIIPKPRAGDVKCTGSMEPAITCLDRLTFREVTDDLLLEVGSVATWPEDDYLVLHRIIAIAEGPKEVYYLTKGDNNLRDDDVWLPRSSLLEAVVGIEEGVYNDDFRVNLRQNINDLTDKHHTALSPCSSVLFTGGSCVVSDSQKIAIESTEARLEHVICNAYSFPCFPPPPEIPRPGVSWEYAFPPSVFCSPPPGTRIVQTWGTLPLCTT